MKVQLFNIPYFFFVFLTVGIVLGLYFLLRNKSSKTIKIVLASILFFNLALHFLKLLFPPYSTSQAIMLRDSWFINICAVDVLVFPFIFLSKSKVWKDFMFYLGLIGGFLAVMYPTEAINDLMFSFDVWRFYICHIIIFVVPLLMVLLKQHELDYKRIWKIPFCMIAWMMFIMINQVLQSELGFVAERGTNFLGIGYKNSSLIWGPGSEADGLAKLFSIFTPNFMKVVPFGEYAGQIKYWPLFWIMPAIFIYFIVLPLLLCLPWQRKQIANDCKTLFGKIKILFKKQDKKELNNSDNE